MIITLSILICALAYTVKGGQFPVRFGKALAAGIVFAFLINATHDLQQSILYTIAWILAIAPSLGEEAGAVGRLKYWWGDYKDKGFDRMYGVMKAAQRGTWIGAVFTVAGATTMSIPIMAIGFPVAHFIGQELYFRIHRRDNWKYAEIIVGALIGLCVAINA